MGSRILTPAEEREFVRKHPPVVKPEDIDSNVASIRLWLTSTDAGNYISETGKVHILALIDALLEGAK